MVHDHHVTLALQKYRALYAAGAVPTDIEAEAILSAHEEPHGTVVSIHYWLKDRKDPFLFFEVLIDRSDLSAKVLAAEPVSSLTLDQIRKGGEARID